MSTSRIEFHRRNRAAWIEAIKDVCGSTPPYSAEWRDLLDIEVVLRSFMGVNLNHAHLPTGGGLDFRSVTLSSEEDCLQFGVGEGGVYVSKPKRLLFEYIAERPAETFLLLEGAPLRPVSRPDARGSEEVLDLGGGNYVDRSHWDQNSYGHDEYGAEHPLPESAALTVRLLGGSILLVCKASIWNSSSATYAGEHDSMTPSEIRRVIRGCLSASPPVLELDPSD